jgi:alkylhydroperoxidase family enzyme
MARIAEASGAAGAAPQAEDDQARLEQRIGAISSHRPASAEAFWTLWGSFGEAGGGTLPDRLVELVRLRIAFWNQCRSCMSLRFQPELISEDMVCSLERPEDADDLTDAEKAALRYADLIATDHLRVDDAVYDDLRRYFSEGELVELGMCCATCVGFGRLHATWRMTDHLHESFQGEQEEPFVPWGGGALRSAS